MANPNSLEASYRHAFENSITGMALIHPEGRWEHVNASLCRMLGYTERELLSMSILEITYAGDMESTLARLHDFQTGKVSGTRLEKRYIRKDGSLIWVMIASTLLKDEEGNPVRYVAQIEDITREKERGEKLLISERKYRAIFENAQEVIYQTNTAGEVIEISPSIEKYSGYRVEEILGHPATEFYYYPTDRQQMLEMLHASGTVTDFEARLKTKNGQLRFASVNARLIFKNGEFVGIDGSMRDVTIRKAQENMLSALNKELAAANKQKTTLFSIIGHDLRNPISGSLQLLDMTLEDYASSTADEVHTYLAQMKVELSNANNLLEDLLTWAKAQFNAISFSPVEIGDIVQVVDKCVQQIMPMAAKKGIVITQSIPDGLVVKADLGMFDTILRNLITNAVKFTPANGQITVKAVTENGGVKFSVADTGTGIPKEKIPQLFDKNSNYTTFGTSGEKGTGLGLNLCNDFVLKHGGQLWVDSEIGVGSTFYFTFPG